MLTKGQLKQLTEFTSNLSLVFLASVLAPLFSGIDTLEPINVILGLIGALISLIMSLLLARNRS